MSEGFIVAMRCSWIQPWRKNNTRKGPVGEGGVPVASEMRWNDKGKEPSMAPMEKAQPDIPEIIARAKGGTGLEREKSSSERSWEKGSQGAFKKEQVENRKLQGGPRTETLIGKKKDRRTQKNRGDVATRHSMVSEKSKNVPSGGRAEQTEVVAW